MSETETIVLTEAGAAENAAAQGAGLASIPRLIERYMRYEKEIENLNEMLAEANARFRQLTEEEIPDALLMAGLSEVKLADGRKVTVDQFISVRVKSGETPEDTEALKKAVHRWLEESGQAHLLTHEFSVKFKKDQVDAAASTRELLEQAHAPFEEKQGVHWKLLETYVRGEIEVGREVPTDILNVQPIRRAKIE